MPKDPTRHTPHHSVAKYARLYKGSIVSRPPAQLLVQTDWSHLPVPANTCIITEIHNKYNNTRQFPPPNAFLHRLSSSDHDESNDALQVQVKILPKPSGSVGRPGSGGYSLEDKLVAGEDYPWTLGEFEKLRSIVHMLIERHLDVTQTVRSQDEHGVALVINQITISYPRLGVYENCWPVRDLVYLRLKNLRSSTVRANLRPI